MRYTIDNIPLKTFCTIIDDPKRITDYNISEENLSELIKDYSEMNPTPEYRLLLESFKRVVKQSVALTSNVALLKIIKDIDGDWKPYFEKVNLLYSGDKAKDLKKINKEINKSQQKEKIYDAQLRQIEDKISESNKKKIKEDFNIQKVNEAIASLEVAGATIPDYDTLTLSKYDALGEIYKQNERRNNKG